MSGRNAYQPVPTSASDNSSSVWHQKLNSAQSDSTWQGVYNVILSVVAGVAFVVALGYYSNTWGGVTVNAGDSNKLYYLSWITGIAFGLSLFGLYLAYRARRSVRRLG